MATISSLGSGSGLDLEGLITKLMTAERKPITTLTTRENSYKSQLSAYGSIKSALSSFQSAAQAIDTRSEFSTYQANVADSTVASAVTSTGATAGSYQLSVSQLAAAEKVMSAGYASASSTIASGTLTIKMGSLSSDGSTFTEYTDASGNASKTVSINISAANGNNTLAGLRDAINSSKSGITATIVNDGSNTPAHLVLTSNSSGTSNSFQLSGISGLNYSPTSYTANSATDPRESTPSTGNDLMSLQRPADAKFSLDGINITSASNVVTTALSGVTLTLNKTNVGSSTTLNVSSDTQGIQNKVNAFIKGYNDLVAQIKTQTKYNPAQKLLTSTDSTSRTDGPLAGDSTARNIQSTLRSILTSAVGTGNVTKLSDIGITIQSDGTMSMDSTKFQAALADPNKDVAAIFAKTTSGSTTTSGIADQIANKITEMLGTDGLVTSRTNGIQKTITGMDKQLETLNNRMTTIEATYRKQFTALDQTVASMNSTSSYLTSQLSSLLTSYK